MSTTITIGKWIIEGSNHQELLGLKKEIFYEGRYEIDCDNESPKIIDAGAHVGLATLYFKSRWPNAKITCIEPHPQTFEYLKKNLWMNKLDDVEVIQAALAEQVGERQLFFDTTEDEWFSTAGFHDKAWNGDQQSQSIRVNTIPLKQVITEPVNILKLDVEGAETTVLSAAQSVFPFIHHIIMEYHPHPKNDWNQLMINLKKHHFVPSEPIPPNYPTWLRHYHFINQKYQQ
jgi:FkbM family methyltransferase